MRKAQAEMIAVVGIIILAIVAILFSFQGSLPTLSPFPAGVAQTQKAVKDSFLTLAKDGADDTVKIMENHGGYLSDEVLEGLDYTIPESIIFSGRGVPYWQQCENDISPSEEQVTTWLETGLAIYILNNINSLEQSFEKDVQFDTSNLQVDANILDNKIDFSINLPTTVQGYSLQQPYLLSTPTNFGRIFSFAKDFSRASAEERFLEYNTLASLYFSPAAADGEAEVPTFGFLQDCGDALYRSPQDLSEGMGDVVTYTLAATLLWQPRPIDLSQAQVFAIESVNGNIYPELPISFFLPDRFAFAFSSPVHITNFDFDYRWAGPFIVPVCQLTYIQKYNIDYPVITQVKDELTGNFFSFASRVFIENPGSEQSMAPGSCENLPPIPPEGQCQNLDCMAEITVIDSDQNPLEGATAVFAGCNIGSSNSEGVIEGPILCESGNLHISPPSDSYEFFNGIKDPSTIDGTYTLANIPSVTIHFREVFITEVEDEQGDLNYYQCEVIPTNTNDDKWTSSQALSPSGDYPILPNIDPDSVEVSPDCEPGGDPDQCVVDFDTLENVIIEYIPAGNYDIDAVLYDLSEGKAKGAFYSNENYPSQDKDLYFHLPRTIDQYDPPSQPQKEALTAQLANQCSIDAITDFDYPPTTYHFPSTCSCDQLHDIAVELQDTCLDDITTLFTFIPFPDPHYICTESDVVDFINEQCAGEARITGVCP